jgi:hypothetical protein
MPDEKVILQVDLNESPSSSEKDEGHNLEESLHRVRERKEAESPPTPEDITPSTREPLLPLNPDDPFSIDPPSRSDPDPNPGPDPFSVDPPDPDPLADLKERFRRAREDLNALDPSSRIIDAEVVPSDRTRDSLESAKDDIFGHIRSLREDLNRLDSDLESPGLLPPRNPDHETDEREQLSHSNMSELLDEFLGDQSPLARIFGDGFSILGNFISAKTGSPLLGSLVTGAGRTASDLADFAATKKGPEAALLTSRFGAIAKGGLIAGAAILIGQEVRNALSSLGTGAVRNTIGLQNPDPASLIPGFGLGPLKDTVRELDQNMKALSEAVVRFSPEVAQAQFSDQLRQLNFERRRANELGPDLARFTEARSNFDQSMNEIKLILQRRLIPIATKVFEVLDTHSRVVEGVVKSLEENSGDFWKILSPLHSLEFIKEILDDTHKHIVNRDKKEDRLSRELDLFFSPPLEAEDVMRAPTELPLARRSPL